MYGCLRSVGRRIRLDDPEAGIEGEQIERVRLAGQWVAFTGEFLYAPGDNAAAFVVVVNLRRQRRVDVELGSVPGVFYTDLVVTRRGSVAWIDQPGRRAEVRVCERGRCLGRRDLLTRTIASGTRIAPDSLEHSGSRLRWRDGGRVRSAPLR